jgi:hypothetical protein
MKLVPSEISLSVNVAGRGAAADERRVHGKLFPDNLRCIVLGSSGSGKTSLVTTVLLHPNGLCFRRLKVITKSPSQPLFVLLERIFETLPEFEFCLSSDASAVPPVEQIQAHDLLFIDDCMNSNLDVRNLSQLFARGRHSKANLILTLQYYKSCDCAVRANVNFICLFQTSATLLKEIFLEHIAGIKFDEFKHICNLAWSRGSFVVVDKEAGSIRIGFDLEVVV